MGGTNGARSARASKEVNPQFIEALKAARKEARIDAIREGMRALHSATAWAQAQEGDDAYHRGLRDGILLAMEAIGYNRWEAQRGMKSGNSSEQKKG
jgi:hypothetical protein